MLNLMARSSVTACVLSLAAVLHSGVPSALQDTTPADPEQSEAGRETYLGRTIARTMHWTGAEWLLRASRQDEENSTLLLSELGIELGQTVCDFGCGNGYYTLPMAAKVGPTGRVLAVDLQAEMLTFLQGRMKAAGHQNVVSVQATLTEPGLEAQSCDVILMVDVYHEISHPVTVLSRLRRALKPGGRLILAEFRLEDPEVPIKLRHKMSKAQMILEMSDNGFLFHSEFDGLPWQHLMAFRRDPDFPRQEGQHAANGRAIAAGLERALRAADLRSLPGYYQDLVTVTGPSRLLREEENPTTRLRCSEWHERLSAHVQATSQEAWSEALEDIRLVKSKVRNESSTNDAGELVSMDYLGTWPDREAPYDPQASWRLTRAADDRWLVSAERFRH